MFTIDPASRRTRPARDRRRLRARRGRRLGQRLARPLRRREGDAGDRRARGAPARRSRSSPLPRGGTRIRDARRRRGRRRSSSTTTRSRTLAELGVRIERHYGSPQDTEWAFDPDGAVWMLQSRPVTTPARRGERPPSRQPRPAATVLVRGLGAAPGQRRRAGAAARRRWPRPRKLGDGDVLVDAHDRARLGAAHAPGRGDRHRLGRHDLPRGDRLARARASPASSAPGTRRRSCATASSSRSTPDARRRRRGTPRRRPRRPAAGAPAPAAGARRAGHRDAAPRQPLRAVAGRARRRARRRRRRAPARRADGRSRRSTASIRARCSSRAAASEFVDRMAAALGDVRRAASRRGRSPTGRSTSAPTSSAASRAASASSRVEANPMIGYRGASALHARAGPLRGSSSTAIRRVWDAGHTQPARDAAVRAHARASCARCRELIARRRAARPARLRALGHGRGALGAVPPRALRRARHRRHLDRLERPDRSSLLGADRDSELLAEIFDERDPAVVEYIAPADPARARARACRPRSAGRRRRCTPSTPSSSSAPGIDAISVNVDARRPRSAARSPPPSSASCSSARARVLSRRTAMHPRSRRPGRRHRRRDAGAWRLRRGPPRPGVAELRLGAHGRARCVAFCRIDDRPIRAPRARQAPDVVVVQDPTLLHQVAVFAGLRAGGLRPGQHHAAASTSSASTTSARSARARAHRARDRAGPRAPRPAAARTPRCSARFAALTAWSRSTRVAAAIRERVPRRGRRGQRRGGRGGARLVAAQRRRPAML